jgi:hypothetical protein
MLPKEYVTYQDKLYWIYRKVKQTQIKEGMITDLKDFWMCDVVVKSRNQNDELLLFLREIEEVKVITDVI